MPDPAAPSPATLSQLRIDRSATPARRRRRWLPWVLVAAVVAGAVAWAFVPRPIDVQVTSVVTTYPSQQYAQLTASGYVVAQRRASVASKGTGRLVELRVREGSPVRQGELIARLDATDVVASLNVAVAAVGQSEASVRQADAGLRQAQAEAANAEVELKRQQELAAKGFVSPQAVDAAERRALSARAGIAAAQATVGSAKAALEQARAQVKVQQVNRDNTEIRAPFDGVVLVKNANVGDMITPFSAAAGTLGAVVTVADMSTLEVEADVSESNVARVVPDQPVEITLDAIPSARFRGSVARIVPTVDRAKATVMTKIRFEKLDPRVLPEMSAKVTFLSKAATDAEQQPVLAVNPKAIVERDGRKLAYRVRGEAAEAVTVSVGRKIGELVEVGGATLAAGDRLVVTPPARLAPGAAVAVVGK